MTVDDGKDKIRQVRTSPSRRSLLRGGAAGMASLIAWLAVATKEARAAKFAQRAVFYRPHPSLGQKCGNCLLFRRPHSCRDVAGYISPNGWCVIWRDG